MRVKDAMEVVSCWICSALLAWAVIYVVLNLAIPFAAAIASGVWR